MIPKIIHWFASPTFRFSDLNLMCQRSWDRVLPDYEIMDWSHSNSPTSTFMREALLKKPVNASAFVRYWAVFNHGGIWLDLDVEVLKPFDLSPACFLGFQRDDTTQDCINTAILGAEKGHPFIKYCLNMTGAMKSDVWPVEPACSLPTQSLYFNGMKGLNVEQMVGDVKVYSKEKFYPWRHDEKPDLSRITPETFCIHHWQGDWSK